MKYESEQKTKVWDPFVRVFHWVLALSFLAAYVTEEDILFAHVWTGYLVLGLIMLRIVWGFTGTSYARFSNFVFKPKTVAKYLKDTLRLKAKRYIGHNPAGGAMIVMMLISLLLTTVSGIAVYGAEGAGPMGVWLGYAGDAAREVLEEVHEFFANFTLLLIVIHVGGVIVESLIHRENLLDAMITGYKSVKTTQQAKG
jgi:cytochrome b